MKSVFLEAHVEIELAVSAGKNILDRIRRAKAGVQLPGLALVLRGKDAAFVPAAIESAALSDPFFRSALSAVVKRQAEPLRQTQGRQRARG